MKKGVIESIDSMILQLDAVLSTGRLKPSERRKLREVRGELAAMRDRSATDPHIVESWALQLGSMIVRIAELLDRYLQ